MGLMGGASHSPGGFEPPDLAKYIYIYKKNKKNLFVLTL